MESVIEMERKLIGSSRIDIDPNEIYLDEQQSNDINLNDDKCTLINELSQQGNSNAFQNNLLDTIDLANDDAMIDFDMKDYDLKLTNDLNDLNFIFKYLGDKVNDLTENEMLSSIDDASPDLEVDEMMKINSDKQDTPEKVKTHQAKKRGRKVGSVSAPSDFVRFGNMKNKVPKKSMEHKMLRKKNNESLRKHRENEARKIGNLLEAIRLMEAEKADIIKLIKALENEKKRLIKQMATF